MNEIESKEKSNVEYEEKTNKKKNSFKSSIDDVSNITDGWISSIKKTIGQAGKNFNKGVDIIGEATNEKMENIKENSKINRTICEHCGKETKIKK